MISASLRWPMFPPGCWLPSPGGTASGACLWHLMAKHSSTGQAQKHRTNPLQASVIFILLIHMEYCITTYHYVSLYYPLHYTTIMYSIWRVPRKNALFSLLFSTVLVSRLKFKLSLEWEPWAVPLLGDGNFVAVPVWASWLFLWFLWFRWSRPLPDQPHGESEISTEGSNFHPSLGTPNWKLKLQIRNLETRMPLQLL